MNCSSRPFVMESRPFWLPALVSGSWKRWSKRESCPIDDWLGCWCDLESTELLRKIDFTAWRRNSKSNAAFWDSLWCHILRIFDVTPPLLYHARIWAVFFFCPFISYLVWQRGKTKHSTRQDPEDAWLGIQPSLWCFSDSVPASHCSKDCRLCPTP